MEVSGQLHVLVALPTGKNPGTHRIAGLGAPEAVDALGKRNISCPCLDQKHGLPNP